MKFGLASATFWKGVYNVDGLDEKQWGLPEPVL